MITFKLFKICKLFWVIGTLVKSIWDFRGFTVFTWYEIFIVIIKVLLIVYPFPTVLNDLLYSIHVQLCKTNYVLLL